MRNLILAALVPLFFLAASTAHASAAEQSAIESQIDAFLASWNRHDFSDMGNYIAEDCDFVNVVGMHWKGRDEIQYAHQYFHKSVFLSTPMTKKSVTVRMLKPDVAIAHLVWHLGLVTNPPVLSTPRTKPDGDYDDRATVVFIKRNGTWLITAMQNVVINEELAPRDPIRLRQSAQ